MITCTTIVLLILVEVTRPILVLRLPAFFSVVSAIYFFPFLAVAVFFLAGLAAALPLLLLAVFFLALLPAAFFLAGFAFVADFSPASAAAGWLSTTMPSCFSRTTV